jgi:AcrR family transcriptional regulator
MVVTLRSALALVRFSRYYRRYLWLTGLNAMKAKVKHEDRKRLEPAERRAQILAEAVNQATNNGLGQVTRVSVAKALGLTDGLINRYFAGINGLRLDVLQQAVSTGNADIVADAIELQMPIDAPPELIAEAQALLAA